MTGILLIVGVGMLAFALGVNRALDTATGGILLAIFGLGMIAAGVFTTDPIRGYPPGSAPWSPTAATVRHNLHSILGGPVAFFALFGACLSLAGRLDGVWRLYTLLTAIVGLGLTLWTALGLQREIANLGLVRRALIVVYRSWIVLVRV